jgi:bis(5'-nucleosyl)-tetraphosphatase (symmetrical)
MLHGCSAVENAPTTALAWKRQGFIVAIWAIGDVQGCADELERLLDRIRFDPAADQVWFVGDLVNRGPRSLEVLRRIKALGDAARTVLGNHDLHLLSAAYGLVPLKPGDTLDEVLAAPDRDELLDWLVQRPLLHRDGDRLLVHAGLLPQWTVTVAETRARAAEAWLQGPRRTELLAIHKRKEPLTDEALREAGATVAALTRLRGCTAQGEAISSFSGAPDKAPRGCLPWFAVPGRRNRDVTVVFGHWAALGLLIQPGLVAVDTGCVWGRELTAVRLDDLAVVQVVRDQD